MPSFLDKLKSGADKAAFEAERLVRVNQAQAAVRAAQRDLEEQTVALGREALALYDAGALAQQELLATCRSIDASRQQVATLEAEVERIRQEKPPEPGAQPEPEAAAAGTAAAPLRAQPVAPPEAVEQGQTCPNCGSALRAGIRFCPECGTKLENV